MYTDSLISNQEVLRKMGREIQNKTVPRVNFLIFEKET